ncbi:MAG: hypothetical protein AAGD28_22470 [Bacteroidota bacterium]
MKIKTLILSMLCMFLSISQIKAQKTPDLQLNFPWTKPGLNLQKDSNVFFKPPTSHPIVPNDPFGEAGKTHEKWPMPMAKPNLDQLVDIPIARLDTSIHYHLRIKDLEPLIKKDKQN